MIVYSVAPTPFVSDVWLRPLSADRKAVPLLNTPFAENFGQISPDGKWFAYDSNETGRLEVYVRPFPTGAGKWQVSTSGGAILRWRRDGRELFYLEVGPTLMAVEISPSGSTLERGTPKEFFDSGLILLNHGGALYPKFVTGYHPFAVSADGQRFLFQRPASSVTADPASTPIAVVVNWTAGLAK